MRPAPAVFALLLGASVALTSCNAIRTTASAVGRGAVGIFTSPDTLADRIDRPVRDDARLAALWIGHATLLVQLDDRFVLTDPNLTNTVGVFSKRMIEPGIDPAHLPRLDAVLISHMHMDHLSYGSLDLVTPQMGALLVPEGGLVYIPNYPFPTEELFVWQSWEKDSLRITAVPVRHPGWRYGLDDAWMTRSATGYVIEYRGMTVYFGGGYGIRFDDVPRNCTAFSAD